MRRLRTVVLEGFKSFHSTHVIDVEEGMTAIVGPNGCGKSNLIDAIAWAVGSRAWRTLRGDAMEDVIFHGTDDVSPAERARVQLVFDNQDRALGLDVEEVEASRELTRGGESRAAINGVEARIKDLQQILAGTGLVGGFAIVRQGTVDQLILGSPEDLGRWIEEAAGIAKYRLQKREILARLSAVGGHLEEAERRREALRREKKRLHDRAEEAKAKQALQMRLETVQSRVTAAERKKLGAEVARHQSTLSDLEEDDVGKRLERSTILARRDSAERELAQVTARQLGGEGIAVPTEDEFREKAALLRVAARSLRDLADDMEKSGPACWATARDGLLRVLADLQDLAAAQPASRNHPVEAVEAIRECNAAIERLDRERAEIAKNVSEANQLLARAEERLKMLPPASSATVEPNGAGTAEDLAAIRREVTDLERKLSKVGPVDETAAARDAEIARELEAVKDAIEDLRETRSRLLRFVDDVDACAAVVFRDTLVKVGRKFQEYIEILFDGGRARLRMASAPAAEVVINEADDSTPVPDLSDETKSPPIEIRAKLPGKSECALSLLSGGERSLAGLALVLALASQDPNGEGKGGRLLILDEVDAALDDANTARLARLLRELAQSHQVLCVTHNARTAREASRLIGVTAGAVPATSLVVDVDLPHPEPGIPAPQVGVQNRQM